MKAVFCLLPALWICALSASWPSVVYGAEPAQGIEALASPESPLAKGERIVFLGDSITQAGAGKDGYVWLIEQALKEKRPDLDVAIIGAGISGNRVPDLQKRLEKDVLSKRPSVVFIYIGINDVWHSTQGRGTPKDQFEAGLNDLVSKLQAAGATVVLATASVIGEKHDGSNSLDSMLDEYCEVSREVAKKRHLQLCDLRKDFLAHLKEHNADNKDRGILTGDTVHLSAEGNRFVAARAAESIAAAVRERKAAAPAAKAISDANAPEEGFASLFDGKSLEGWTLVGKNGPGYVVEDGLLVCPADGGGNLFTKREYANFILRCDIRMEPGGNNGVGIRAPLQGDAAYVGMEIQILDDPSERYATIQPWQRHGSIYGVVPAKPGALKKAGEWNTEEIACDGRHVKVTLNGQVIVDANLDDVKDEKILEAHPGLKRTSGHIGFLGHGTRVELRNVRVKELPGKAGS